MSGGGEVMAKDYNVRFLGRIPIDPQFLVLIETGKRPIYPKGTSVNGQDISTPADAQANESETRDSALLVHKYKSCSLAPIFGAITTQVVADVLAAQQGGA